MEDCLCTSTESQQKIEESTPFLKAIADPTRLKIICFLKQKPRCVCEITVFLNLPQNLVSHHLKTLKQQKILSSKKKGLKVWYSLEHQTFDPIIHFLHTLIL